jgi:hypothetical protein
MRRFCFQDRSEGIGIVAEGLQLTDGRVVVQATRVQVSPVLYRRMDDAVYDWRSAELEWIDPEAAVAP